MGKISTSFTSKDRDSRNTPTANRIKLTQKNLLFGFGAKYYLKENLYIGFRDLTQEVVY
jgi:hypothetical protein